VVKKSIHLQNNYPCIQYVPYPVLAGRSYTVLSFVIRLFAITYLYVAHVTGKLWPQMHVASFSCKHSIMCVLKMQILLCWWTVLLQTYILLEIITQKTSRLHTHHLENLQSHNNLPVPWAHVTLLFRQNIVKTVRNQSWGLPTDTLVLHTSDLVQMF
jgi:hypothetical protein